MQSIGRHLAALQSKGMEVRVGFLMPMIFTPMVDEQKVFPGLTAQLLAQISLHKS